MYYGARYYLPGLRWFISADTIVPGAGNPQALNRYSYVLNRPMTFTDPSGHWPMTSGLFEPGFDKVYTPKQYSQSVNAGTAPVIQKDFYDTSVRSPALDAPSSSGGGNGGGGGDPGGSESPAPWVPDIPRPTEGAPIPRNPFVDNRPSYVPRYTATRGELGFTTSFLHSSLLSNAFAALAACRREQEFEKFAAFGSQNWHFKALIGRKRGDFVSSIDYKWPKSGIINSSPTNC
jgi:hypothetical protein